MLIASYAICAFISFIYVAYLTAGGRRRNVYPLMICIVMVICNTGYLALALSKSTDAAIFANDLTYMGGCFMPLIQFLIASDLCKIKIPRPMTIAMLCISLIVMCLVFSTGYSDIYYRSVELREAFGATYLVKEYGPAHNAYSIMLYTYIALTTFLIIYSYRRRTTTSYKTVGNYALILFFIAGVYIVERATGIKVELVPFSYVLCGLLIVRIYDRLDMYDMTSNVMNVWEKTANYAYIELDRSKNYIGSSALAKTYFSELTDQRIDYPLVVESTSPLNSLINSLDSLPSGTNNAEPAKKLYVGDSVLNTSVKKLYNSLGDREIGYLFEFFDITKDEKYLESIKSQNIRLAVAEAAAQQANVAKDRFLANMSHEIRTPVNTIIGMNEIIMRESTEDNIKEHAYDVKTAASTLLSIINQILDLSKIESGKMEIVKTEYKLNDLITNLYRMTIARARSKGLNMTFHVDSSLPSVLYGDDSKIKQVISNLLTNAIKYTHQGSVDVRFSSEPDPRGREDKEHILLKVEVQDTGIGIKREDLIKLFLPFERLDIENNRNIEGTGLGMNITQRLLIMMGSRLNVESEYGKGSLFSFVITQDVRDPSPVGEFKPAPSRRSLKAHKVSFTAPGAKILVIDDNVVNIKVFTGLLKPVGCRIDEGISGDECIRKCREKQYDLIFLDEMMPGKSGTQTLEELRKDTETANPETPVCALTAEALTGAREKFIKAGFTDYLSKPVDIAELETMMKKLLPSSLVIES